MTLLGSTTPLVERYDVALVDLDGVAYRGPEPIDFAASSLETARSRGMKLVFVTNNASREPQSVADHLHGVGVAAAVDEVMTAAQAAAALAASRLPVGARVLVVGGAGLRTAVAEAGFALVESADDSPVAVVQGYAADVGWADLAEAAYAIQRGALHIASNRDLTLPTERGFAPGNGSLVGAVVAATGVEPISAGKPEPAMFQLAVERLGATAPLVVGDRLDADLAGARAAGYPGLHVLTGVDGARAAVLARREERPSYLAADLRGLLSAHPAPALDEGWWVCGEGRARVRAGRLELAGTSSEVDLDLVRAACSAAWAAADEGSPVDSASVPDLDVVGS